MKEALKFAASNPFLSKDKINGENFDDRMRRFGIIEENVHGEWDLSDRDENAIRTANAVLILQKETLEEQTLALLNLQKENAELRRICGQYRDENNGECRCDDIPDNPDVGMDLCANCAYVETIGGPRGKEKEG